MSEPAVRSSKHVLDPVDHVSEVLFGLIMVLTFTGSLSVAEAGREDIRTMLVGAVGCNLAWGIIDGILYLMGGLAEKGRSLAIFRSVRVAADPREARRRIADALPSVIASVLQPAELEALHPAPDGVCRSRRSEPAWTEQSGWAAGPSACSCSYPRSPS